MSIQSNINQTISLAGALRGMNPAVAEKAHINSLRKQAKAYGKVYADIWDKAYAGKAEVSQEENLKTIEELKPLAEKGLELQTAAYEALPSPKRYEHLKETEKDFEASFIKPIEAAEKRKAEIEQSREFAKMITEGVYTNFNPNTYIPPERKK